MPRYTKMLSEGMTERGHEVQVWYPRPKALKWAFFKPMEKWLGYVDQYLIFPRTVKKRIKTIGENTLFVFMDHALGPWVPLVESRPHVIHCHDFLAQRSALGEIKEHKTGWTGKLYQRMIRNGFTKGKHFISVSKNTKLDLHRFLTKDPITSEVIYNGFNQKFAPGNIPELRTKLSELAHVELTNGYILHVGGNHWYKNRPGVIEIYNTYRSSYKDTIPLVLLGNQPDKTLLESHSRSLFKCDIHFLVGMTDTILRDAYAAATLMLFPSYEEGFGWPIAEAMASGSLVITTDEPPMTEVAHCAGFYIPRSPGYTTNKKWAAEAARVVHEVLNLSSQERDTAIKKGFENASRFDQKKTLDKIEKTYTQISKRTIPL